MITIKIEKDTDQEKKQREEKSKRLIESVGKYGATGYYLTKDEKPWYPVMGEFHYSRFHPSFWREEVAKMKAGGIQVLATYVFWIHHEEKQGEWDFEGQKNLRKFLAVCQEEQMPVFLRIGPWAHGECRNGGFPDWLVEKEGIELRSDDPGYLELVKGFWKKIFEQADGFFYHQGGNIIGIQIENEYGHCGGLQGEDGMQHMKTLKKLAEEMGFVTPYYTATGWGGGIVPDVCLPVLASYVGAPWDQHTNQMPLNANFVFTHYKDDKNVGSDLHKGDETGFTYDTEKMPYLMAELGGGLQVTGHRRPYVTGADTAAMALCKAGSGANLLGYYMYHGGTNPWGKYSTLQESKATGYSNDLPVRSYDFQAPIGEYGAVGESYYKLRPFHLFLKEFGDLVARGDCILPPCNSENLSDGDGLRIGLRHQKEKGQGFLFYNRHQRHGKLNSRTETIQIQEENRNIELPEIHMKEDTWGWIPYAAQETEGMEFTPEFRLYSSNYTPLCSLGDDVVFFGEGEAEILWQGQGNAVCIEPWEAEHGFKHGKKLYAAEGCLMEERGELYLLTQSEENTVTVYPEKKVEMVKCEKAPAGLKVNERERNSQFVEYELDVEPCAQFCHDLWINLEISGDRGEFWIGGKAGDSGQPDGDWFYQGKPWKI
ncbi:MAG: beta-galactosidase, partial [Clostridiales bacterium]|nr:beta-galactosidase [Clostridiales bacterium]